MAQHGTHNGGGVQKASSAEQMLMSLLQSGVLAGQGGLQCSDTAPLIVDFVFRHQPPSHYNRGPPNISLHRPPGGKPFLIHLPALRIEAREVNKVVEWKVDC